MPRRQQPARLLTVVRRSPHAICPLCNVSRAWTCSYLCGRLEQELVKLEFVSSSLKRQAVGVLYLFSLSVPPLGCSARRRILPPSNRLHPITLATRSTLSLCASCTHSHHLSPSGSVVRRFATAVLRHGHRNPLAVASSLRLIFPLLLPCAVFLVPLWCSPARPLRCLSIGSAGVPSSVGILYWSCLFMRPGCLEPPHNKPRSPTRAPLCSYAASRRR